MLSDILKRETWIPKYAKVQSVSQIVSLCFRKTFAIQSSALKGLHKQVSLTAIDIKGIFIENLR